MATRRETVDILLDQIRDAGAISTRKMFGEYALYCDEKVVALVCDDMLFLKPTKAGEAYLNPVETALPYPGAKPWFLITADRWEDGDWLSEAIRLTARELPLPKPKRKSSATRRRKSPSPKGKK